MKNIMFICHGNICRSPTAELLFNHIVKQRHLENRFHAVSSAVSTDTIYSDGTGSPVYSHCRVLLEEEGIDCSYKRSVQLKKEDYNKYDLLVLMDADNYRRAIKILGGDPDGKIKYLAEYIGGKEIADPWYTRDFNKAISDIKAGVVALIDSLC